MVVLGLVLLLLCLALGTGITLSNTEPTTAEAFGVSLANVSLGGLFLVGVALGAIGMLGLGLMAAGAARKRAKKVALKREVRDVRGEQESLAEENARLQAALERERTAPASTLDPAGGYSAAEPVAGAAARSDDPTTGGVSPDDGERLRGKHAR